MKTLKDTKVQEKQKEEQMVDPSHIMKVGMGFWASKILLTAVKLELFTKLATQTINS